MCEDFSAIQCPVYAISGWADGYCNAVFRLLAGLSVPRKGLVGPWAHKYPHLGVPGPAIGFLQEACVGGTTGSRARNTGIMDEPMLRVWMQESTPPSARYEQRPGRWIAEPVWPSPNIVETPFRLTSGHDLCLQKYREVPANAAEQGGLTRAFAQGLDQRQASRRYPLTIRSPLSVGLYAGKWCSYNAPPDCLMISATRMVGLIFQTSRLEAPLEICGQPVVELEISADQPVAMLALRLIDVADDDKATRVSYGLLNLTHRDSNESS